MRPWGESPFPAGPAPEPRGEEEKPPPLHQITNARAELRFNGENGAFEVYDSVTRCTWTQAVGNTDLQISEVQVQEEQRRIQADLLGPVPCALTVELVQEQQADVLVTVTPNNVLSGEENDALVLAYPHPFQPPENSHLALPTQPRETFAAVKSSWNRSEWFVLGQNLTAPWFGCAHPGGGYIGIVQAPAGWQCALQAVRSPSSPAAEKGKKRVLTCLRPVWRHTSGDLGADLRVLYHFTSATTYVGLRQAYQEMRHDPS